MLGGGVGVFGDITKEDELKFSWVRLWDGGGNFDDDGVEEAH